MLKEHYILTGIRSALYIWRITYIHIYIYIYIARERERERERMMMGRVSFLINIFCWKFYFCARNMERSPTFTLMLYLLCVTFTTNARRIRSNCRGVSCTPARCVDAAMDEDGCCLICPDGRKPQIANYFSRA